MTNPYDQFRTNLNTMVEGYMRTPPRDLATTLGNFVDELRDRDDGTPANAPRPAWVRIRVHRFLSTLLPGASMRDPTLRLRLEADVARLIGLICAVDGTAATGGATGAGTAGRPSGG